MAKYNWQVHRVSPNSINIYHFARRLGKTTKLIERMLESEKDNAIMLCSTAQVARYTVQQARDILHERNIECSTHNENILRISRPGEPIKSLRFMCIDEGVRRYMYHYGGSPNLDSRDFYIDNIEYFDGRNPEVGLLIRHLVARKILKAVSLTADTFRDDGIRVIFFHKILACGKKTYYNRIHDERTFNRYINFGNFSSRADADAELRPRSLLAS
jgi:hypothetical protein